MIDATRGRLPADMSCVIDAAITGDAVAVGVDAGVGATISIVTHVSVANCPALSHLREDRYVATIGGGTVVGPDKSVLADKQWSRSRDYLLTNPIALAAELPARRMLAVAQPDPLDGWLAIDALDPTAVDKQLADLIARWKSDPQPAIKTLASKLVTSRQGAQVLVRIDKPEAADVIALVSALAHGPEANAPTDAGFACPRAGDVVKSCQGGRHLIVTSTVEALHALTTTRDKKPLDVEPVVEGGDVIGVRLIEDAGVLLQAGDVILGIDDRRVGTQDQLAELARGVGKLAALAIRRNGVDVTVTVAEAGP